MQPVVLKRLNTNLRDLRVGAMHNMEIRIIFATHTFSRHIVRKCPVTIFLPIFSYFRSRSIVSNFYVLLTVHLTIILGSDQLDTQFISFTIRLL
jgi:hypothetical protein